MRHSIIALALVSLSMVLPASAQDRDTVFLHGLHSDPAKWDLAAGQLRSQLAIRPLQPALDWRTFYETQAASLNRHLAGQLSGDVVAVGHSNGGVVAREWTKSADVRSLITLGSPNQGAPLVNHLFEWLRFLDDIFVRVSNVNAAYSELVDHDVWWWLPAQWIPRFSEAFDIWRTASNGLLSLGFDVSAPIMPQMRVGSAFMSHVNSEANLEREASAVRDRVAIVSVPSDFTQGGPFRVIDPDRYRDWHYGINIAGIGLDGLGILIRLMADPTDDGAFELADHISVAAEWFLQFEGVWCLTVSDSSPYPVGRCYEHDGIVPAWSQAYDHPRVPLILDLDGPIHTREMSESRDQLFQALTTLAHVEPRAPGFVPPPVPPLQRPPGRYKLSGGICSWDPADTGPDQCSPPPLPPGRFKVDGAGACYWDASDYPPDQCSPPPPAAGRFKINGAGGCYWDPNDGGPDQCVP